VCVCVCVCVCVSCAGKCSVGNSYERGRFVLGSNDYTRLEIPDTEDGGATMLRNADNPLTVDTA
jgi:hypothetical protein